MSVAMGDFGSAAITGGIFVISVSLLISYLEFLKTKRNSIVESLMNNL
jgi:hypothetical protein